MALAPRLRTLQVGEAAVVSVSGIVDAATALLLESALSELRGRRVIVDLLAARDVDDDVRRAIVRAAPQANVTVVADPQLLHVFELLGAADDVALRSSLSEAVTEVVRPGGTEARVS